MSARSSRRDSEGAASCGPAKVRRNVWRKAARLSSVLSTQATETTATGSAPGRVWRKIEQWITRSKSAEMKRAGAAANAPVRNCRLTSKKGLRDGLNDDSC